MILTVIGFFLALLTFIILGNGLASGDSDSIKVGFCMGLLSVLLMSLGANI